MIVFLFFVEKKVHASAGFVCGVQVCALAIVCVCVCVWVCVWPLCVCVACVCVCVEQPYLEHQVNGALVGGDGHGTALWDSPLGAAGGVHGLGVGQGLDLQAVLLHHRHRLRVHTLQVAWGGGWAGQRNRLTIHSQYKPRWGRNMD